MTARDLIAAAVIVWLAGLVVGWCAGWAGRGEHNRGWHAGAVARWRADIARAVVERDDALARLDDALARLDGPRGVVTAAPVVHVHVTAPAVPPGAPPPQPVVVPAVRALERAPVVCGEGVRS